MTPRYLLYDEECSLCVRFQKAVRGLDRRGLIEPVGFHDPRISRIVPRMTQQELLNSFHLVFPDGRVVSGHRAIPDLLKILPGCRLIGWLLKRMPFTERISERIYIWIASRREKRK